MRPRRTGVRNQTISIGALEFATRLRALGLDPEHSDVWFMVGNPTQVAGWKLHVSATVTGVDRLFEHVLPYLARHGAAFKIAAGSDAIVQLSAGNLGEAQIGKVITVYPRNDADAVALACGLIEHTRGIVGPRIATDLHLGEAVYTRYGSVRPRITYDRFGKPIEEIPDGRGNWLPDLRPVPFSCPPGIVIPFPTAAPLLPSARPAERRLLAGRYFVTDVLRPGIAGSVFRAVDLRDVKAPLAVVLKQARPHCSEDEFGRDRRVRLRHEGEMLARLQGLTGVAPASEYFEEDGIGYLPVAYVPGLSLGALVYEGVAGRPWSRVRAQPRQRLLGYAIQLVRRLRAAHARGVVHRDVAPANVWIGDDDCVYLIDWECAHVVGSPMPAFRLGTPGFSDLNQERRPPTPRDDWQACGRVLAFMLTGLDPLAFGQGPQRELAARLADLTGLRDSRLIELLAQGLADETSKVLNAAALVSALADMKSGRQARRRRAIEPLFTMAAHESVLAEGLEMLTAKFRSRLEGLLSRHDAVDASAIDVQGGIAGLLYVLAAAHGAGAMHLDTSLTEGAARVLTDPTPVIPDLPGLVQGRAGRALAVAAAVQAGCISADDALRSQFADALEGRLDWPDFTHGAAGQGFAALACAQRLGVPRLAHSAVRCAEYLVRTQDPDGGWTLPQGGPAGGERYTGFAHGTAGIMGFLGSYAAQSADGTATAAWRRAESWLVGCAKRGRGGKWQWPQSDTRQAPAYRWCHGAPGIALGWLCVARALGIDAIREDTLRGALDAIPHDLRSDCLGLCHGLAGVGEVYLEAHWVLRDEQWGQRAADIAKVLVALFRRRARQPWHYLSDEPPAEADGLMLGTAGILHFLLRQRYSAAVTSAPLLQ